jgi:hypothetical protein
MKSAWVCLILGRCGLRPNGGVRLEPYQGCGVHGRMRGMVDDLAEILPRSRDVLHLLPHGRPHRVEPLCATRRSKRNRASGHREEVARKHNHARPALE